MHPVNHLAVLNAFFGRLDLILPAELQVAHQLGELPRYGLVLHMAGSLIAADFGSRLHNDRSMEIAGTRFAEPLWRWGMGVATKLAFAIEAIEREPVAHHGDGCEADRLALLMRRLARAGLTVDADALAREGVPSAVIIEFAQPAVGVAEAIRAALNAWQSATAPAAETSEAA
jgi:hypothetical protein